MQQSACKGNIFQSASTLMPRSVAQFVAIKKTKTENKEEKKLGITVRSVKNIYANYILSRSVLNLV